jgi:hypothetical protein
MPRLLSIGSWSQWLQAAPREHFGPWLFMSPASSGDLLPVRELSLVISYIWRYGQEIGQGEGRKDQLSVAGLSVDDTEVDH